MVELGGLFLLFALFLGTGLVLTFRRRRLPGVISTWGVHYNLDSIYAGQDIEAVVTAFVESWCARWPTDRPNLIKALSKLDIYWHATRMQYTSPEGKTSEVLALMPNPQVIHLWIGPKLKNGTRNIVFTGLLDQLSKLAQLANGKSINSEDPEVRKVLAHAREKLF